MKKTCFQLITMVFFVFASLVVKGQYSGNVTAETSANLYSEKGLVSVQIVVSNPASSSYIRFINRSGGLLTLTVESIQGEPLTSYPGGKESNAAGTHYINPGAAYWVAFHIPYGEGPGQNIWATNFTLSPAKSSGLPTRQFQLDLVNAPTPDGSTEGDNSAAVQFTVN